MEPISIYAATVGGIFLYLFLVRISPHIMRLADFLLDRTEILLAFLYSSASLLWAKYLTYAVFLPRHNIIGPCTRSVAVMHLAYAGVNLYCALLPADSLTETSQRAGNLSLINLIVAVASGCYDLCADTFGISRHVCQQVHRATAWMSVFLFLAHAMVASLANPPRMENSGLIVCIMSPD